MVIVNRILLSLVAMVAFSALVLLWLFNPTNSPARQLSGLQGDANRGAYLARLGGCFACHTDWENKGELFAGGGPINTDFGVFYAPNISKDGKEGLGRWSLEDFSRALTDGISPSGQNYFPVFPYENYRYFTDQDIVDLWTAFKTVPAIGTASISHDIAFPFNQRRLLTPWKKLFLKDLPPEVKNPADELTARGAYIVNGPGHCIGCHTPRNVLGGLILERYLQGGTGPDGEVVPAITQSALAKREYTRQDIVYVLKDGIAPDGDVLGGSMGEVIAHNTRWLTEGDLMAIADYLWQIR